MKLLRVTSLIYESVVQILCYSGHNIDIYRRLNFRILVQVRDLPYTQNS